MFHEFHISHIRDDAAFQRLQRFLEGRHPSLRFGRTIVDGYTTLRADYGGVKTLWLFSGSGEVLLKSGFRTKEGDGDPLPGDYLPDEADRVLMEALDCLKGSLASICAPAQAAVYAILSRRCSSNGRASFVGDMAGDIWKLEQTPRPWSPDNEVNGAIRYLFSTYRRHGYSQKQHESYEHIMLGDQLIAVGDETLEVRGNFECLTVEHIERRESCVPAVMRLRHLKDSSGGCNFDFDPFRRLPLTWYTNLPGETCDGVNFVNSHIVNIPHETSPTHFHPERPVNGGLPQDEMYLVLDPQAYKLNTYGREASVIVYPDLRDLTKSERHSLTPGDIVYIPAGAGHRGMDVFANVITIPGFKPHNEYYLDRDLADAGADVSLVNQSLVHLKNYQALGALL